LNPPSLQRPFYLDTPAETVFAMAHEPDGSSRSGTGVVIVPPFGWDDVCSYRPRRDFADRLAGEGHVVLRIDLPGCGDSAGGPRDANRVSAWTAAVTAAVRWLRDAASCERVAAIGLGLGGLIACRAAADGGGRIDDLVLWGTPARGRTLLREMRAFARLKAAEFPDPDAPEPPPLPEGLLEVAGYVITPETAAALEGLDLTSLGPAATPAERALLLERDGLAPDSKLRAWLDDSGVAVSVEPGPGWSEMTDNPQHARTPLETLASVSRWLAATSTDGHPARRTAAGAGALVVAQDDARIRETPMVLEQPFGRMFGILSEPLDAPSAGLALVLVNAGAVRRIGPNRMWVEAARRWAARGVPVLRLDIEGLGDSDGDGTRYVETPQLYAPSLARQVVMAIDELERREVATRFVVSGLCAGASWSFHAALEDPRVSAAVMINLWAFFWDEALPAERDAQLIRRLVRPRYWLRVLRGDVGVRRALRSIGWLVRTPFELRRRLALRRARGDQLDLALDRIRDEGKRVTLILSRGESLYDQLKADGHLERLDRWPNFRIEQIDGRDHTFRALFLQAQVHALMDRALAEELAARGSSQDGVPSGAVSVDGG
jgi:dienelactone hydrolase